MQTIDQRTEILGGRRVADRCRAAVDVDQRWVELVSASADNAVDARSLRSPADPRRDQANGHDIEWQTQLVVLATSPGASPVWPSTGQRHRPPPERMSGRWWCRRRQWFSSWSMDRMTSVVTGVSR